MLPLIDCFFSKFDHLIEKAPCCTFGELSHFFVFLFRPQFPWSNAELLFKLAVKIGKIVEAGALRNFQNGFAGIFQLFEGTFQAIAVQITDEAGACHLTEPPHEMAFAVSAL